MHGHISFPLTDLRFLTTFHSCFSPFLPPPAQTRPIESWPPPNTAAGAAIYKPSTLKLYDIVVLKILGKGEGVRHNLLGRFLMLVYNKKGVFGNVDDTEEGFVGSLREHFEDVETSVVGVVLLLRAEDVKRV